MANEKKKWLRLPGRPKAEEQYKKWTKTVNIRFTGYYDKLIFDWIESLEGSRTDVIKEMIYACYKKLPGKTEQLKHRQRKYRLQLWSSRKKDK